MTPLIIAYVLNIIDYLFTRHWVNLYGIDIEGNPIGRWLIENHLAVPVKVFGVGGLLIVLYHALKKHPKWNWTSWLLLAVYSVLAIYHIFIAFRVAKILT